MWWECTSGSKGEHKRQQREDQAINTPARWRSLSVPYATNRPHHKTTWYSAALAVSCTNSKPCMGCSHGVQGSARPMAQAASLVAKQRQPTILVLVVCVHGLPAVPPGKAGCWGQWDYQELAAPWLMVACTVVIGLCAPLASAPPRSPLQNPILVILIEACSFYAKLATTLSRQVALT